MVDALGGPDGAGMDRSENRLAYPRSRFDNLRAGFPGE